MSAKDIDLTYGPDGRTLQLAKLMEQSVVQLPSEGGARRIGARMIDMTMAADGSTVTQLNAAENVHAGPSGSRHDAGEDDQSVDPCRLG